MSGCYNSEKTGMNMWDIFLTVMNEEFEKENIRKQQQNCYLSRPAKRCGVRRIKVLPIKRKGEKRKRKFEQ